MDSVALVKLENGLGKSLERGLDLIGGFGTLQSQVLIKPNICTISDDTGYSVTNVDVVAALIDYLFKVDDSLSIKIVESDSQSKYAMQAFEKFGYQQMVEEWVDKGSDVSLVDLSRPPLVSIQYDGAYSKTLELAEILYESKYFISVAVSKTHPNTFLTGVLKNQFGLLPRKDQGFYHSRLDDVILDLNRFIKPDLCIVDARVGVEGWNGPKTRPLDALILGYQPVSVDATMARIMGFQPSQVKHIIDCSKFDLGTLDPIVLGQSIEDVKVKFKAPS
ncbi:MAG: DUF362 domain-containing protein [Candidatus Thorarchaeota archaeon]|nr:DUF362 domain-containing protein [Candidatus Thorarchaeota archaeon]